VTRARIILRAVAGVVGLAADALHTVIDRLCRPPWPSIGQDGEPTRPVTVGEYAEHCARHEPPPLGCERHHDADEVCGPDCADRCSMTKGGSQCLLWHDHEEPHTYDEQPPEAERGKGGGA
jgi:hypothetical protein